MSIYFLVFVFFFLSFLYIANTDCDGEFFFISFLFFIVLEKNKIKKKKEGQVGHT